MSSVWAKRDGRWSALRPAGFSNEAELQELVAQTPAVLPLSGAPEVYVLGTEVTLGPGRIDILAVERSGRPVIIEVKLARNDQARRAVVSQVLSYAAHLSGLAPEGLDRICARFTQGESIVDWVDSQVQDSDLDREGFLAEMQESLDSGGFRLVILLDSAPAELVTLVGYLESISADWVIDLITVKAYEVAGETILVPQRVDPERRQRELPAGQPRKKTSGTELTEGPEAFSVHSRTLAPELQREAERLTVWAKRCVHGTNARLFSYKGTRSMVLLPRMNPQNSGFISMFIDSSGVYVKLWRSMFERYAPGPLAELEDLLGVRVGQGSAVRDIPDEALEQVLQAYRQASE